jgi:RNA polymerase sigma factor (sigma-70 family)
MSEPVDETPHLLQLWHQGDQAALGRLVELHLPWLQAHVERRLGAFLRERADPADYLQDIVLEFLRDGPRFQVRDGEQFRRLLACVAENTLRDRNDWYRAKRRDLGRNAPLPSESVLALDPGFAVNNTPSRVAAGAEMREWVRLSIELLPPEDRKVILARDYDDRSFVDIGEELGMTAAAVRMRWVRAVGRLAETMKKLRAGEIEVADSGGDE